MFLATALLIALLTVYGVIGSHDGMHMPPANQPTLNLPIRSCPNGILTRREIRDLSKREWDLYIETVLSLQRLPSPDGSRYSEYDYWANVHYQNAMSAHGSPQFLVWHRALLSAFEKRLQQLQPTLTIPYWDFAYDWSNPLASPIFQEEYGMAVRPGPQGDCRYRRQFPQPHCLTRAYNPRNFTAFYSNAAIRTYIRLVNDSERFRQGFENSPHNLIHRALGGETGDMTFHASPNDPVFWLLHSAVDKIYWDWQQYQPSRRMNQYSGTRNGRPVQVTDELVPFGVEVADVLDIGNLCYQYADFSRLATVDWDAISVTEEEVNTVLGPGVHLPVLRVGDWLRMARG